MTNELVGRVYTVAVARACVNLCSELDIVICAASISRNLRLCNRDYKTAGPLILVRTTTIAAAGIQKSASLNRFIAQLPIIMCRYIITLFDKLEIIGGKWKSNLYFANRICRVCVCVCLFALQRRKKLIKAKISDFGQFLIGSTDECTP